MEERARGEEVAFYIAFASLKPSSPQPSPPQRAWKRGWQGVKKYFRGGLLNIAFALIFIF